MRHTVLSVSLAALLLIVATPGAQSSTSRNCKYVNAHADSWVYGITVARTRGMRCSTGARILRSVAPALKTGDYRHLGLSPAKRIAGYDCVALLIGDSAWHIDCTRNGRAVIGFTAN